MRKIVFFLTTVLLAVLAFSSGSFAAAVKNPQNADYMKAEVTQSGSVSVGDVSELNVSLYIPQSDSAQAVEIESVGNPDYFFEKDRYGNGKINMFWKNPGGTVTFEVKSIVTVNRRDFGIFYNTGDFSKPTELIQSTDPEIKTLAENITIGKQTDFEKIAALTKWVNENIQYDLAYSNVNLSATAVLHIRKGVCDEFSTLLLSMARALGYQASYSVGYAYGKGYTFSEGDFAAHGWTEIFTPSGTIISDPTWGEIPVDATHIRFASLADSIYPEVNVSGIGRSPLIKINPTKTYIKIIEERENPILQTSSTLLDSNVWKGYAVVRTDISAPDCALTTVSSRSCTMNGKFLMEPQQNSSVFYFCGNRTVFSIFSPADNVDAGIVYTCLMTVAAYNANPEVLNLTLEEKPLASIRLSLDRTMAEAGENVFAHSPGAYLFTSDGQSGFDSASFIAGDNMIVYAYKAGALESQQVAVVKQKPFDVSLQANETYFVNETGFVNITVSNLLQNGQNIVLSFRNATRQIYLEPLSEKTLNLSFVPASTADNFLQAFASGSGSTSYTSRLVEVQEIPKPKGWWENISEGITNFFKNITESIGKFFAGLFEK